MADEFNELDFPISNGNNSDNVSTLAEGIQLNASFLYGFNGGTWDRLKSLGTTEDGAGGSSVGNLRTASLNFGFNGVSFDRLRSDGNDADNVAPSSLGVLNVNSYLYGFDGGDWDRIRANATSSDGQGSSQSLRTFSQNYRFNGSTFDRERGNTEETLLASAARTATNNSADFTNFNAKGLKVVVDVSAAPAAASITVEIQGKDPISGNYYTILLSAAFAVVGTNILEVYPGISEAVNQTTSRILPRTYRVLVTHADGDSITYSVSGALVV